MSTFNQDDAPNPQESLGDYVRRIRASRQMSQRELAEKAGLHLQSVGKIERGQTKRLKQKPKARLAIALGIAEEYLDAVCRGVAVPEFGTLKFCPLCWTPGSLPDPLWTPVRAKYCYACGDQLRDRCGNCDQPILSLKFKFCPHCGRAYKGEPS